MQEIIKRDKSKSHQEFEKLLLEDLGNRQLKEGEIITGTVSGIGKKHVFVDIAAKSEGAIPIEELKLTKEIDKIKIGSQIEVYLEKLESNFSGDVVISRQKALRHKTWQKMEECFNAKKTVTGNILSRVKGGFAIDVSGALAFLPGSQISLKPLNNTEISMLMKNEQTFEIVKMDKKRANIVLSRRSMMERARDKDKDKILSTMKEGDIVNGIVKNITEWGAFIDLSGVDSLLHITDISWSRINKPSDLLSIGQSIKVKITKITSDRKLSCSIKNLTEDPYLKMIDKYKVGNQYTGTVTKIMDYGVFCKLDESVEGLIHQSQLSWTKKSLHPGKIVTTSQKIKVELLEIDKEKRRLSLSLKNCSPNPFKEFSKNKKVGEIMSGVIKNRTDYGLFVSIDGTDGLDGLIHYKDLHYDEKETHLDQYRKGQDIKFRLLEVNEAEEKIRLGVKQLEDDEFTKFFEKKKKSDIITVTVNSNTINGIYVNVGNKNFTIFIKKNQLAKEVENQRPARFVKGDKLDVVIAELEKDKRKVSLSIKALEEQQTKAVVKKYGSKDSGGILSDIFDFSKIKTKKKENKK